MRISAAFKLPTIGILSALLLVCTLTANAAGLCVPGQAVEVLYAGQWYPARVIEGPDNSGTCKISYDGYGSNWDEWVNAQRLRPAANVAAPATKKSAKQGSSNSPQPGVYKCYSFDSGQLNYTHTDIVIQDAGRYRVGNKGGTFNATATGSLQFTGSLSNAVGKYSVKNTGRAQIDLVFNGDARSSMACTRSN